ncbi:hypothetical protein IM793_00945 [Pedobacter sp. MR2016-19]|uniref:hypothetical protein n=1 Tax=Pedobacter sp. MR2016-19 TaxID=2780089 RepID=UPI001876F1D2|nr:hypothetical protein [Pedobacter sp. MR2016-19]MBE5317710.1 hypothetical protein [Pedobacter sp. MR2016-19]
MPEDYQDLVLATYKKKCEERKLHLNLLKPTVVKLKKECLKKYDASDEAKDVFSGFFDKDKMDNISLILSKADPGDFRPLLNHINGATKRTDEKNSELLAWLIDFQPRPSTTYYKSFDGEHQNEIEEIIGATDVELEEIKNEIIRDNDKGEQKLENGGYNIIEELDKKKEVEKEIKESNTNKLIGETENKGKKEPVVKSTTPSVKINEGDKDTGSPINVHRPEDPVYEYRFSPRYITIACIILLFVGTTSFVAWENSTSSVRMPNADEKCMYWNEDHYEPVKCNAQIANATIIPLDLKKLQRQRKINLSDTLTSYSLGKVWYKGFVKDHEFFTAAGPYPTDTTRVLKKLSPIILAKYISNNRYLQTRLIWLSYAIIFVVLCGFGASRLKKEVKPPVEKPQAEEEPLNFTQQQPVNC